LSVVRPQRAGKQTARAHQGQRRAQPMVELPPRRALSSPAELGRAGVSQPRPLQPAAQGRALRRLGAAEVPVRGDARGLQVAAQL